MPDPRRLRVGLAQIAAVVLDRGATMNKVVARVEEAAREGCGLVVFGETVLPGYPAWIARTDGARFDAADQKALHAAYLRAAVQPEAGDLADLCACAARHRIAVMIGVAERAADRGGHSLYCSRVFITADGAIASTHRKLMPTYEERLSWSIGDGAGLVVHPVGPFRVGGLNCYENWMPLARVALQGQGEDLHVALWPGAERLTGEITRFLAREARSYVISISGLMRADDFPATFPHRERLQLKDGEVLFDGGSAVAGPDGDWVVPPVCGRETLIVVDLDHDRVLEERQNFDPAGHYARPDVLRLVVDRTRQSGVELSGESGPGRPVGDPLR
ncbi:MAG: carbon-nitrogen hydrolase family protein [Phycisphaerales bacterium]|nr:carbon-nitrogen hydrolase family protein [Phycisphaerae bacterium]NNF43082.1 carbon-nitrogen hydrolase family protein [Phycisphaerales bacterium]NNM25265.1 carbon-nitrogen hydrolase family protein [Phycisphaerales bacterium]